MLCKSHPNFVAHALMVEVAGVKPASGKETERLQRHRHRITEIPELEF